MDEITKRDAIEEAVGDYDPEAARRGRKLVLCFAVGLTLGIVTAFPAGIAVAIIFGLGR